MAISEFTSGMREALRLAASDAEARADRRDMLGLTEAAEALRDFAESLRASADGFASGAQEDEASASAPATDIDGPDINEGLEEWEEVHTDMTVGENIADRRTALGMSQKELALAARVDVRTIHNAERDKHVPHVKNLRRIEAALQWRPGILQQLADQRGVA